MQETGIVKKIDSLGRLVLPKEIRKSMKIKSGDYLEFIIKNDDLIIRKYSKIKDLTKISEELISSVYQFLKYNIFIADSDNIVAYTGTNRMSYIKKEISDYLENCINRRETILEKHFKDISFIKNELISCSYIMKTIIHGGESIGIIVMFSETEKMTDSDMRVIDILSSFLSKYLES